MVSSSVVEMQCMLRYPQRPTQLLMGGIQDKMISFDLEKGKECQLLDTGGSCAVLKYHGRFVGCGDTSGKIHLRDPHNLRSVSSTTPAQEVDCSSFQYLPHSRHSQWNSLGL